MIKLECHHFVMPNKSIDLEKTFMKWSCKKKIKTESDEASRSDYQFI